MAVHSSADFATALNPVFRSQTKQGFEERPSSVGMYFTMKSSDRNQENYGSISHLPEFSAFTGALSYVAAVEGYNTQVTHKQFANAIQVKRQLLDDDQHGQIADLFREFGRSAWITREKDAVQPWNTAFELDTEFYTTTEGVALSSTAHTTPVDGVDTSTGFSNYTTEDLSATALATARWTMRKFKDYQGEPMDDMPDELMVPVELEDLALEITKTPMGLDTAGQNINVQSGRFKVMTNVYLSDVNNWFVHNGRLRKKHLFWIDRVPLETKRMESFETFHLKGRGYMRYSYGRLDWRWIYGSQVA